MANSIVFQNSAEQLKTAIFGYDGTNYQALKVNNSGELDINVGTLSQIGTINTLTSITNGTVDVTTLSSITSGTIATVSSITNGTVQTVLLM